MNATTISKTAILALIALMTASQASAQPRRWRVPVRPAVTIVTRPAVTVGVSNKLSQSDRLSMALAYIHNHGYITVKEYARITGLRKSIAEAELDAFATGRRKPLTAVVKGRKKVYFKA